MEIVLDGKVFKTNERGLLRKNEKKTLDIFWIFVNSQDYRKILHHNVLMLFYPLENGLAVRHTMRCN